MPQSLTDNTSNFVTNVRAPADSDSPLASGQLRTALQDLADRTGTLKRIMDLVTPRHIKAVMWTAVSSDASIIANATTSWVDLGISPTGVAAIVGDQIVAFSGFVLKTVSSGRLAIARQENGGAWTVVAGTEVRQAQSIEISRVAMTYATIASAGTLNLRLQCKSDNSGDAATAYGPVWILGLLLRNES